MMTLYCNVLNIYLFLFARKNEKEEKEKLLIVLMQCLALFIENDRHMTNHVTYYETLTGT